MAGDGDRRGFPWGRRGGGTADGEPAEQQQPAPETPAPAGAGPEQPPPPEPTFADIM